MRIVIIVLTLLWFLIGAKLAKSNLCGDISKNLDSTSSVIGSAPGDCNSTLNINDKEGGLEISSKENFQFAVSSGDVMGTSSEMAPAIQALTTYLNSNPNRFMEITGLYLEEEENNSDKDNLGKARAVSVRSYLLSKGVDGKQLTTKGQLDNTICRTDVKIVRGVKVAFNEIPSN